MLEKIKKSLNNYESLNLDKLEKLKLQRCLLYVDFEIDKMKIKNKLKARENANN